MAKATIKEQLATLLNEAIPTAEWEPEQLGSQRGVWRSRKIDLCKWYGDGTDKETGLNVHVASWSTMTECVRYGIAVEMDTTRFDWSVEAKTPALGRTGYVALARLAAPTVSQEGASERMPRDSAMVFTLVSDHVSRVRCGVAWQERSAPVTTLLLILAALQLGDIATTIAGLAQPGVYEINPVGAWLFGAYGVWAVVPLKLGGAAIVFAAAWLIQRRFTRPRALWCVLWLANAGYAVVVLQNAAIAL